MISSEFMDIKIAAVATAVPKNKEILSEKYNTVFGENNVAKFTKTTGIYERRVSLEEQTSIPQSREDSILFLVLRAVCRSS